MSKPKPKLERGADGVVHAVYESIEAKYRAEPWSEPLDVYEARTDRIACILFAAAVLIAPFIWA